MLKLLKYEFRKERTALLVLLVATALCELLFLQGTRTKNEVMTVAGIVLLILLTVGSVVFVFVRGLVSYTSDLSRRSGWLTFLTPRSPLSILGAKYLFTFLNAVLFLVLFGALCFFDLSYMSMAFGAYTNLFAWAKEMLAQMGIYVDGILAMGAFSILYALIELVGSVGLAYLAVTLSRTLLEDRPVRGLISVLFFAALVFGVSKLYGLFPNPAESIVTVQLNLYGTAAELPAQFNDLLLTQVLPAMLPRALASFGVLLATLFSSAALLKHRISL